MGISGVNGHVKEERCLRFWRIAEQGVLETETRRAIYEATLEEPGRTATEYAQEVGVDRTTASYHLEILEHFGYAHSNRQNHYRRYFGRERGV